MEQFFPSQVWVEIPGTYGEFIAPGSESTVSYVLTHAALANDGTPFSQLTRSLVPVRELFDVGDLNFDELLQRDLDDHRVATEIIPYLLAETYSARFFPPILAAILPVQGKKALNFYPPKEIKETKDENGYTIETTSFEKIIELERTKSDNGVYGICTKIRINPDQAKLVVLDGQHRAMAILAIKRSQNGEWGDKGSDYRHFYEDIARQLKNKESLNKINKIELPVCLIFLPDLCENSDKQSTLVQAFRKLFLDVNKEARKPTRARQLLLDDSHIISILSRSLLSRIRNEGAGQGASEYNIDLDSFEYDSPRESPKPQRDLAICTIEMIYELIKCILFADDGYYIDLKKKPTTGRQTFKCNRFLNEIKSEEKISKKELNEWGFSDLENELVPTNIPNKCHQKFSDLFMDMWGDAIISFYSQLHPLRCHIDAVADLRASHISETGHGKLAWRALFDGQGIYWTIKNYAEHRKSEAASCGKSLPMTDVEKAYDAITKEWIPNEFEKFRAAKYYKLSSIDRLSKEQISSAKRSFGIFRTMAFQIGFLMAIAYLKKKLVINDEKNFKDAVLSWISGWNYAFISYPKSKNGINSLSMFDPQGDGLMGRHFGRLQKSEWIWFRYFAFEMLNSVPSSEINIVGKSEISEAVDLCRYYYIKKLAENIIKEDKKKGKDTNKKDALAISFRIWCEALKYSLGISKSFMDEWWNNLNITIDEENNVDDDDNNDDDCDESFDDSLSL